MANLAKPRFAPRNPVVRSPLLQKGGMHSSERPNHRLTSAKLKSELSDWREELNFERSLRKESQESSYVH